MAYFFIDIKYSNCALNSKCMWKRYKIITRLNAKYIQSHFLFLKKIMAPFRTFFDSYISQK